jgi:hypothetical protein
MARFALSASWAVWHGPWPQSKQFWGFNNMNRNLYTHPDGFRINYCHLSRSLECSNEPDAFTLDIPIGEAGLIDLGLALVALGFELRNTKEVTASSDTRTPEQTAEQEGAIMGLDLVNELLQLKHKPQSLALQAVHDKIYALSMVQPFDAAAGGFAVALVNTLQIGIANLSKVEAEE